MSSHHLIPFMSHFILILFPFIFFSKIIQMLKISAGLSPIKMWFMSTKRSLIKDSEKVRRWAAGQSMENKQTNKWTNEKSKVNEKRGIREQEMKTGGREGERIDRAYCWLQSISSPDLKWILHLNMEKVLTLWNTNPPPLPPRKKSWQKQQWRREEMAWKKEKNREGDNSERGSILRVK